MDDNDFEIEAPRPLLPAEQQEDDSFILEAQPIDAPPPSPRKRAVQIGLVALVFVVAAVLIGGPLVNGNAPGAASVTRQPTVSPQTALLLANINFGTVTINGHRQRGTLPMFFKMHSPAEGNSVYQIVVDAPPFDQVTCTVSFIQGAANAAGSSDCQIDNGGFPEITANGVSATPDFVVSLNFTADSLPDDQQSRIDTLLLQSIAFQHTMAVPAGSYVATGYHPAGNSITSQRATRPLQATAFLNSSTDLHLLPFPCTGLVCSAGPILPNSTTDKVWAIEVPVALRWLFTAADGRVLGDVSFPVANLAPAMLTYDANAGWSLAPGSESESFASIGMLGGLDCSTGGELLQQMVQFNGISFSNEGDQEVTGCKITLQDIGGSERGTFLWRFGVLMAADKAAHDALPNLPIAPQAEIDAVPDQA